MKNLAGKVLANYFTEYTSLAVAYIEWEEQQDLTKDEQQRYDKSRLESELKAVETYLQTLSDEFRETLHLYYDRRQLNKAETVPT